MRPPTAAMVNSSSAPTALNRSAEGSSLMVSWCDDVYPGSGPPLPYRSEGGGSVSERLKNREWDMTG